GFVAEHTASLWLRMKSLRLGIAVTLLLTSAAFSQAEPVPYILRLSHENLSGTTCALLQQDGTFHSEVGDRYSTRVYQGKIPGEQVTEVEGALQKLTQVSQRQIEEPLIHGPYDTVDVAFTERGRWRALLFQTTDSQAPYKKSLEPLLHWMDK